MSIAAIQLSPGMGETIDSPIGGRITFKARGAQTGGAMSVFESVTPPGEGPPFHVHEAIDELIYVLDGTLRVRLGDQVEDATAGAFVFIPRGQPHTWQSYGNTPVRFLVVVAPAGLERLFDGAAAAIETRERRNPFTTFGGEDLTVLGPPLAESHPV